MGSSTIVIFSLDSHSRLRTDHAALTHLLWTSHLVAQSAWYLDTLAEYQFSIQYRPGLVNSNANELSQQLCNQDFDVLLCGQCGPTLDTIEEEREEESDHELEQGGVVEDELSADPTRMVAGGASDDETAVYPSPPGGSVLWEIGPMENREVV